MKTIIREAKKKDFIGINKVINSTFCFNGHTIKTHPNYIVAEYENEILGIVHTRPINQKKINIELICVDFKYYGNKIGTNLINKIKENTIIHLFKN